MSSPHRDAIAALVRVAGSIRSIAIKAGISPKALTRWVRGDPTVSETKLTHLLAALGVLDGAPDPERVHLWEPRKLPAVADLNAALSLFFHEKPEAAVAPWSHHGRVRLLKLARVDLRPEIAAFFDGRVMVVLRTAAALMVHSRGLRVDWRNGTIERSDLDPATLDPLLSGQPTPEEFRRAWVGSAGQPPATLADLDAAVKGAGISYAEAIARVRRHD